MSVVLLAHYEAQDPERLIAAFDGYEAERRRAGAVTRGLARSLADPGTLVAVIEFASRAEAEAFAVSPERAATLREAGVTGVTDELLETVRRIVPVASA
jgi:hypothetical protein